MLPLPEDALCMVRWVPGIPSFLSLSLRTLFHAGKVTLSFKVALQETHL